MNKDWAFLSKRIDYEREAADVLHEIDPRESGLHPVPHPAHNDTPTASHAGRSNPYRFAVDRDDSGAAAFTG
jgi:hypothetical protein